jgi:hypothetical protein
VGWVENQFEAFLVNNPSGGKVETVFTFAIHLPGLDAAMA